MTDTTAQHDGAPLPDPLYELLPPIFRMSDIAEGYPLLALCKVFDRVRADIGDAITELEDDWFIQTCPLDLIPYIAAQLGLAIAQPVRAEHRALVADALGFRRRKGTASAIPRRVRDGSGWYALFSPDAATPPAGWPLGAAQPAANAGNLPPARTPAGLLRVWRLQTFAMIGVTPAGASTPGYFHFNPLGITQPLYNLPNTPLGWVAVPPVTALPPRLTTAMLAADLEHYNRMWPMPGTGPGSSMLYGAERGLVIRYRQGSTSDWMTLGADGVRAEPLGPDGVQPPAPDFPVLEGGALALQTITAQTTTLNLNYGDAHAVLTIDVPDAPSMSQLVTLLEKAIADCPVTAGTTVSEADVRALVSGALGNALLIVPATAPMAALSLYPAPGSADPLRLSGSARTGIAAATFPLDEKCLALLNNAPPGTTMTFTAPTGKVLDVGLPFGTAVTTPAEAEAAFAGELTACFVCLAQDRVVIVAPVSTQSPIASTPPAWQLGLVPAVTIDPEQGLFSWPAAWPAPAALAVDYGIAMPGAIGGIGLRGAIPLPAGAVTLYDAGETGWIVAQLSLWESAPTPCTVLMLQSSATRYLDGQAIAPPSGDRLWIASAAASQALISVSSPSAFTLTGANSGTPGAFGMSGIMFQGQICLNGGNLDLTLLDMTLIPATGPSIMPLPVAPPQAPTADTPPPAPQPPLAGTANIVIERTISTLLDFSRVQGTIALESCALSPLHAPPGDMTTPVLIVPLASARISRTTVMGSARLDGALEAVDSLFAGTLTCTRSATFSNCYVTDLRYLSAGTDSAATEAALAAALATHPPGLILLRCEKCAKVSGVGARNMLLRHLTLGTPAEDYCSCGTATPTKTTMCQTCTDAACTLSCPAHAAGASVEPAQAPPAFCADNRYPLPDFARLEPYPQNPRTIIAGATNHDELGVYNLAVPTARRAELDAALDDALLEGTTLDVRFES